MKVIDNNGCVWELHTNSDGHTKIQCLDGLSQLVNSDDFKYAKENGYYCNSWEEALLILHDGGYIHLQHPVCGKD
jgi:hypothetical protein